MPSANVELVQQVYVGWGRGDYRSGEWAHPEIEIEIADGPNPGTWRGRAGMADSLREHLSAWKGAWVEAEGFRELDDERVLVLTRRGGKGRRSGIELAKLRGEGASIFHVRDGKVTKQIHYFDRERALADLGLDEPDIEVVRRAYTGFDPFSGEGLNTDLFTEDFAYQPSVTGSETVGQVYVGAAGWRDYQRAVRDVWSVLAVELLDIRLLRSGVVLTESELRGVGRSSGAPVAMRQFAVARIRDGRIAELRVFQSREEALRFAETVPEMSRSANTG